LIERRQNMGLRTTDTTAALDCSTCGAGISTEGDVLTLLSLARSDGWTVRMSGPSAYCPDCVPGACSCNHPPARCYSWWASGDDGRPRSVLCVACCECGTVLRGAA
jgi:hypothetical protein